MAILTFRSETNGGDNSLSVNNVNAGLPTGTASGDLQVIWVSCAVLSPGSPPAMNTPAGWVKQGASGSIAFGGGTINGQLTLFTKIADGSDGTVNLATSGGTNAALAFIRKSYQNPDTVTPFAQVSFIGATGGPDTSPVVTGITTGANAALIDVVLTQGAAQSATPPGSMTERADNTTYAISCADEIIPTAGATGTRTFTLPASTDYLWGIAEFRSANVVLAGTGGSLTLTGGEGGLFASGISGVFFDGEFFQGGFFGTPATGGFTLDGTGGTLTLTGGTATLRKDRRLTGTGAALTIAGGTAQARKDFRLTATGGALALTGGTAQLRFDHIVVGAGGALTLAGGTATLTASGAGSKTLTGDPTALTLTGGVAALKIARILVGAGGALTLSGGTAALKVARILVGSGGALTVAGGTAQLRIARILVGAGGALTLTGGDASLSAGGNVSLDGTGAALTLLGGEATLEKSGGAVASGPTPAGGVSKGGKRKRKVVIGDRVYEVDSLRDVEFLLKRVVREEAEPVTKAAKARIKVVDRVTAKAEPEAFVALPVASVEVDWSALWRQLAAQDTAYADALARVLAKQEEDDIETILLML